MAASRPPGRERQTYPTIIRAIGLAGSMSPELGALLYLAAVIALASALVGGIYLLLRNETIPEEKTPKKNVMSNVR
jgi:hypothetical protein